MSRDVVQIDKKAFDTLMNWLVKGAPEAGSKIPRILPEDYLAIHNTIHAQGVTVLQVEDAPTAKPDRPQPRIPDESPT